MRSRETSWYEPLRPGDAAFVHVESPRAHMHIGGVFLLEGRAPSRDALAAHVERRLDRIPRYRQKLAFVPLGLGRPVWIDDPAFRIDRHVRRETLSPPGGDAALRSRAARIFAEPLDRGAPLWELTLIDGVDDDHFALVWKTHHCVLDGIAFLDVLDALTDPGAGAEWVRDAGAGVGQPWTPRPAPAAAELLAASLDDQLARAVELAGTSLRDLGAGLKEAAGRMAELAPLVALGLDGAAPPSSLNRRIGPDRAFETAALDAAAIQRVRARHGGTFNDVVLAVVAGALRTFLSARGESLDAALRVFVPVNVRRGTVATTCGNEIGAVYCPLPVAERDAVARLRAVSASMARLKESGEAHGTAALTRMADLVPAWVAADAARREARFRRYNLVVSTVPGPREHRWLLGRRLASLHFAVPLAENQTLSMQFFTYAGTVGVGLLGEAHAMRDLPRLATAVRESLDDLLAS